MLNKLISLIRRKIMGKATIRVEQDTNRATSPTPPRQERPVETGPAPRTKRSGRKRAARAGEAGEKKQEQIPARPAVRTAPWTLADFAVPPAEGKSRFHDFPLPLEIMHAIAELGFEYCTPIQEKVLPVSLAGRDVVARAQTGTGKTAAFLITVFTRLAGERGGEERAAGVPRALIIAPTRELVVQITKDAQALARHSDLVAVPVFGGADYQKQREQLELKPVDLLVATPGRLLDYIRQRVVRLDEVEILVLDEADRMLDMGFIPDVRRIVHSTSAKEKRQTMLFSATITEEVKHLAFQWGNNPMTIESEPEQVAVETVEQLVYLTTSAEKYNVLYNLITRQHLERVIVFTNRRDEARKLTERLKRNSINCAMLSGDVEQKQRMQRLEDFRAGKITVLVATDVAGRGIHIEGISHVINYTLPYEPDDYVHRIGRTGRAGAAGISISFACEEGAFYLPEIEAFIGRKLNCQPPPEGLLVQPPRGSAPPQKGREDTVPAGKGRRRPSPARSGRAPGRRR